MAMFYEAGKKFEVKATAPINYHDVVVVGGLVGVACTAAKTGDTVSCDAVGVFCMDKVTTLAVTQGATVYLDADKKITTAANTAGETPVPNTKAGIAWAAAAQADTTVLVKLNS